ncbi:hypothetical protein ATANTOWER_003178 [Ataeniobius toweri]|uniref:Uncharacterized protein n=1 Tax=Ataeniobius toweri TaxID=208326 RepID=A0ABU7B4G1_9TELE|nr:hypothetical protein [Ataeniobius toweri]
MPRCFICFTCGHGNNWKTLFQLFEWLSEYIWQYIVCKLLFSLSLENGKSATANLPNMAVPLNDNSCKEKRSSQEVHHTSVLFAVCHKPCMGHSKQVEEAALVR